MRVEVWALVFESLICERAWMIGISRTGVHPVGPDPLK